LGESVVTFGEFGCDLIKLTRLTWSERAARTKVDEDVQALLKVRSSFVPVCRLLTRGFRRGHRGIETAKIRKG
jgi:hypothetical protein